MNKRVLLTNDDHFGSPFLPLIIDELKDQFQLTSVFPLEEKSWNGKGMTCVGELTIAKQKINNNDIYVIDGLPADCINIAIYNILNKEVDFVISGVNIGRNTGVGFVFTSGTVGACLEANIAGIPAISISQDMPSEEFLLWKQKRVFSPEYLNLCLNNIKFFLRNILPKIISHPLFFKEILTWNINLPYEVTEDSKTTIVPLNNLRYQSCFQKVGTARVAHKVSEIKSEEGVSSDEVALKQGDITISILNIKGICYTEKFKKAIDIF